MNWWRSWRLKRSSRLLSESPYNQVRERIVRNLKTHPDSVPLLVEALDDQWPPISRMAAKKLGDIRDARAIGPLLDALGEQDPQRYQAAADALSAINPAWRELPETDAVIANCVSGLKTRCGYEEILCRRLARVRDPSTEGVLLEALRDGRDTVRKAAAEALGELRTLAAVEPLNHILNEAADKLGTSFVSRDDSFLFRTVAEALGKIGDRRSIGPLTRLKEGVESKIGKLHAAEEAADLFGGRRFQAAREGFEPDIARIASDAASLLEATGANAREERYWCASILATVGDVLRTLDTSPFGVQERREGAAFERFDTKSSIEAIEVLLASAVPTLPVLNLEDIQSMCSNELNYDVLSGQRHLVDTAEYARSIVEWNVENAPKQLASDQRVVGYQVTVQERLKFAVLTIFVGDASGTPGYGFGVRLWRASDRLFVQGWEGFQVAIDRQQRKSVR